MEPFEFEKCAVTCVFFIEIFGGYDSFSYFYREQCDVLHFNALLGRVDTSCENEDIASADRIEHKIGNYGFDTAKHSS